MNLLRLFFFVLVLTLSYIGHFNLATVPLDIRLRNVVDYSVYSYYHKAGFAFSKMAEAVPPFLASTLKGLADSSANKYQAMKESQWMPRVSWQSGDRRMEGRCIRYIPLSQTF
jgi:hypothetical protein